MGRAPGDPERPPRTSLWVLLVGELGVLAAVVRALTRLLGARLAVLHDRLAQPVGDGELLVGPAIARARQRLVPAARAGAGGGEAAVRVVLGLDRHIGRARLGKDQVGRHVLLLD